MDTKELQEGIEELRKEGYTDEEMLEGFYGMYKDGELDYEQYKACIYVVGYEPDEEFENMTEEQRKNLTPSKPAPETTENDEVDEEEERKEALKMFGL